MSIITIKKIDCRITVELRLRCVEPLRISTELSTAIGEFESSDLDGKFSRNFLQALCGSGVAFARSVLRIAGGIIVSIERLEIVNAGLAEEGIPIAVALAVSRELNQDIEAFSPWLNGWREEE